MFNNVALDVAIGLVFIFLVYSLLATTVQEMIARSLSLRGRMLVKGIRAMLEDRHEHYEGWFIYFKRLGTTVIKSLKHFNCPFPEESLSKKFYEHPTIKYLSESSWHSKPGYIGPENFSDTMIRILRGEEFDGTDSQMNAIKKTLNEWSNALLNKNVVLHLLPKTGVMTQENINRIKSIQQQLLKSSNLSAIAGELDKILTFAPLNTKINDTLVKQIATTLEFKTQSGNETIALTDTAKKELLGYIISGIKKRKDKGNIQVELDGSIMMVGADTMQQIQQLYIDAQGDISRFKTLLENWFNHTMDRVNGWYKKQTQLILLIIGFAIACSFNVDTIGIYKVLAKDKKAREAMVQMAISEKSKMGVIVDSLKKKTKTVTDTIKINRNGVSKDSIATKEITYIDATNNYLDTTYKTLVQDADEANQIMGLGKPYSDSLSKYNLLADLSEQELAAKNNTAPTWCDKIKYWFHKINSGYTTSQIDSIALCIKNIDSIQANALILKWAYSQKADTAYIKARVNDSIGIIERKQKEIEEKLKSAKSIDSFRIKYVIQNMKEDTSKIPAIKKWGNSLISIDTFSMQKKYADSVKKLNGKLKGTNNAALFFIHQRQYFEEKTNHLKYSPRQTDGWVTLLGWFITALAISLGAPFWFDMLNKLMELRSSGKKSDADKPDKDKSGSTEPSPTQKIG